MTSNDAPPRHYSKNVAGITRRTFLKYSAGSVGALGLGSLMLGCGGRAPNTQAVLLSDIHFNPFYDPKIVPTLMSSDVSQWEGIFKGSTVLQPSTYGADTNYPLLVLAMASIK